MAALAAITLLSLPPTFTYLGWSRRTAKNPNFQPDDNQIKRLRGYLKAELAVLVIVPAAAAFMARGY